MFCAFFVVAVCSAPRLAVVAIVVYVIVAYLVRSRVDG
jgi:hypothetical protein